MVDTGPTLAFLPSNRFASTDRYCLDSLPSQLSSQTRFLILFQCFGSPFPIHLTKLFHQRWQSRKRSLARKCLSIWTENVFVITKSSFWLRKLLRAHLCLKTFLGQSTSQELLMQLQESLAHSWKCRNQPILPNK